MHIANMALKIKFKSPKFNQKIIKKTTAEILLRVRFLR
jgi:hypothetical protein